MTERRSRRERKENSRYPGSIQYSQEEVEMEAEEPPDGDRGSEKEVSHRGAPLVKPLPRSVIHTMSDSDTEVEAEWQEVKGRRSRREGRHRRHTDGENNLFPGQGEE